MRGQVRKYRSTLSTVAIAFFIGELGDKTQLAAITLAMDAAYPWIILLGTVSAMLVISAIGIGIGTVIGKNIPERLIKMVSAILFFVFGSIKLITLFWDKIDVLFIVMEIVVITVPFILTVNRYLYKDNKI
jgi:putative Ca2+/H+ antiporter (TMEM165/GDT1 family)